MSTYLKILNQRDFSAGASGKVLIFDIFELNTYPNALRISHYDSDPEKYTGIFLLLDREGPPGVKEGTDPKLSSRGLFLIDKEDVDEIVFTGHVRTGTAYGSNPHAWSPNDDHPKRAVRLVLNQYSIQTFEPFPYAYRDKTISMMLMQL